ncbi:MAG: ABC transporter substrate-binding protein [Betaproteobacteria bacterium]
MKRRELILAAGALAAAPLLHAQAGRVARVGILTTSRAPTAEEWARMPFRNKLNELGWAEGRNLTIERRFARSAAELPRMARELSGMGLDAIYVGGAPSLRVAMQEIRTTPIVMFTVGDPVASGWVRNLARPEGNVTGVAGFAPDLGGKRVSLLKELVPAMKTVAVLSNPTNARLAEIFKDLQERTHSSGVQLRLYQVAGPADIESAFADIQRERMQGLVDIPDPMTLSLRKAIVDLAARHRLPAIYESSAFADAGGLIAYGPDYEELARRAAIYVDKVLRGARPSDLPVEFPTKFELVVNLKAARALGIVIPQSVLLRADRVIE